MKKYALFLLAFPLMLSFVGCSSTKDAKTILEISPIPSIGNSPTGFASTPAPFESYQSNTEYSYGNMQKNTPPGNFMNYENQIIFQYEASSSSILNTTPMLYTLDKTTGKVSSFCKDATCTHTSSNCISSGAVSNLEQYNGKLYALNAANQIMEFKNGCFQKIADGAVYNFWHANGNLYAVTRDCSLVVFKNGSSSPQILIDEYKDIWNVVFDNYLYGCSSKGISRVDLSAPNPHVEILVQSNDSLIDGQHIYYYDSKTFLLYCCDMDGNNVVQLTEQPVIPSSTNFDDHYLYFRLFTDQKLDGPDSHDLYRISKEAPYQMDKIMSFPNNTIGTIYTVPGYDRLIVKTYFTESDGDSVNYINELYLVAKDGSTVEKLEIPVL